MLKMSNIMTPTDGQKWNKQEIIELIKATSKPIAYTYGFKYKHPTTYMVAVSKEHAIDILEKGLFDVEEKETYIDINEYSSNDLF